MLLKRLRVPGRSHLLQGKPLMTAMTDAVRGPVYQPSSPWHAAPALLVAMLASFAPLLLWFLGPIAEGAGIGSPPKPSSPDGLPPLSSPFMMAQMMLGQLLSLGIAWMAAGWKGARTEVLQLAPPQTGFLTAAGLGALLVVLILPVEVLFYRLAGLGLFSDSAWLLEGLRSPLWWGVVIVAVVLAPLWEEITFRGFLLSALAQTRLGFWSAAVISSLLWTFLHWGYSWPGLASVFLAGMGLSWIMQRTASMRAVVVAHGVINAFSLAVITLFAP
jgi:membrane protease YdiL (CAAX protease family)